jgi:death on curing protein
MRLSASPMLEVIYLTAEQIELIHAGVLAKSGGLFGTREPGVLAGLESSPRQDVFGKELHPTLFHKTAVYMRTIITQHPFLDGNKRTGIMSSFTFLEVNGYRMIATDDEVFKYALFTATEKPDGDAIARWLESHATKVSAAKPRGKKKSAKIYL